MSRYERLDLNILIQSSFFTYNELKSALSISFVSKHGGSGLDSRNGLDARKHIHECNIIQVRGKGSEDYETWMAFAKKVAVLTMCRNIPLLFCPHIKLLRTT